MEVKITFADGLEIEAIQNGNCFIVDEAFEPGDLAEVTIESSEGSETLHDAELIEPYSADGRYWFAFREISVSETEAIQLRADVDYLLAITE